MRYSRFWRAFLHRTYRGGFPLSLTTPYLWRGGNQSTQGAVHHVSLVRCVQLKKKNPNILNKKKTTSNYPYLIIKQCKHSLKETKKHIHYISLKPTQNISKKFTIFLKSIARQSIVSNLDTKHQINSHT